MGRCGLEVVAGKDGEGRGSWRVQLYIKEEGWAKGLSCRSTLGALSLGASACGYDAAHHSNSACYVFLPSVCCSEHAPVAGHNRKRHPYIHSERRGISSISLPVLLPAGPRDLRHPHRLYQCILIPAYTHGSRLWHNRMQRCPTPERKPKTIYCMHMCAVVIVLDSICSTKTKSMQCLYVCILRLARAHSARSAPPTAATASTAAATTERYGVDGRAPEITVSSPVAPYTRTYCTSKYALS